jgi:HEPN domain-containing protein
VVQYDDVWLLEERAAEDLSGAEDLLKSKRDYPTLIRFHLQQFVEKSMKASLRKHNIVYPRTHDLLMLLELFPQGKVSEDDEFFVQVLSQFAVESRYGECIEPPWNSRQMLEMAKGFVKFVETLWEDPSN